MTPKPPGDLDAIIELGYSGADELPARKADLVKLGVKHAKLLLPFWEPEGTWLAAHGAGVPRRRIQDFGYTVLANYLRVMVRGLRDYGIEAVAKVNAPFAGKRRGSPVAGLGKRVATVSEVTQQAIAMFIGIQATYGLSAIEQLPASIRARTDQVSVALISDVFKPRDNDQKVDAQMRALTVRIGLSYLARMLKERADRGGMLLLGPYTQLRLSDFVQLAKRSDSAVSRHGVKNVESVFETQLSLLVQSLGFFVVRAQRATRRVDLFCLMANGETPYTAMIEAKTAKQAYSLPADDERALVEYVGDVRRSLGTLPPLAFLLIVGSRPAATLESKLAELEAKLGIPVRFLDAESLARLRDQLPGPIPAREFRELLDRTPTHVLDVEFGRQVQAAYSGLDEAHAEYVGRLMKGVPGVEL